jgi:hypothetical protein
VDHLVAVVGRLGQDQRVGRGAHRCADDLAVALGDPEVGRGVRAGTVDELLGDAEGQVVRGRIPPEHGRATRQERRRV